MTAVDALGNTSTQTRLARRRRAAPHAPAARASPAPTGRVAGVVEGTVEPKVLPAARSATVRVTSSEAARLAGVVQRKTGGRWKTVGRKQWSVVAGANTEKLYGKAAQPRLMTGTYRVRLVATDAAGNASATTTIGFRVDRG